MIRKYAQKRQSEERANQGEPEKRALDDIGCTNKYQNNNTGDDHINYFFQWINPIQTNLKTSEVIMPSEKSSKTLINS